MVVKTQYSPHDRVFKESGCREHILYSSRYDENGVLELVEKGRENIYDYIQSFKDSVDIHVLLTRYANGDVSALARVQGAYGDFTGLPTTYADLLNKVNDGKAFFEHLPVSIREKFGHDFGQWMSQIGTDAWSEKMGFSAPANQAPADPAPADTAPVPQEVK